MGNGMNKVLPGLYVGNYRDSKDHQQLDRHSITHIVAIHDSPRRLLPDKHYLCIMASDTPDQNISQYFSVCNDFIHAARLRDGNVLIHCLAGMSRSVTVTVAYIMSVTNLSWKEALKVVRTGRSVANPNLGFQMQLRDFELFKLTEERKRLKERFPALAMEVSDKDECTIALSSYERLLSNKDICEGDCSRGQNCPTGLCNTDIRPGIFRRKSSSSRSRLSVVQSSSCPTSPRQGMRSNNSATSLRNFETTASIAGCSSTSDIVPGLHRSASSISTVGRPRSSPSGLFSYTGSAPSSAQGSRIDLTSSSSSCHLNKGSAIYLGCAQPRTSIDFENSTNVNISPSPTGSRASIRHMNSSGVSQSVMHRNNSSQRSSPNVSPKHTAKSNRIKPIKSSEQST